MDLMLAMPLVAQLADAFDGRIFAFCLGLPLIGAFTRVCIQGYFRGKFWRWIAAYYCLGVAAVAWAALFDSTFAAGCSYLMLLAGPILGLMLMVTAPLK